MTERAGGIWLEIPIRDCVSFLQPPGTASADDSAAGTMLPPFRHLGRRRTGSDFPQREICHPREPWLVPRIGRGRVNQNCIWPYCPRAQRVRLVDDEEEGITMRFGFAVLGNQWILDDSAMKRLVPVVAAAVVHVTFFQLSDWKETRQQR